MQCNCKINYGYHFKPKDFFAETPREFNINKRFTLSHKISTEISTIEPSFLEKSLEANVPNYFMQFLESIFTPIVAAHLKYKFKIGSAKYYKGGNVFWQIDEFGKIRSGKIMLYDVKTGRRIKNSKPTWIHAVLKLPNFALTQCFFGLHQLAFEAKAKPIAIVESEKTAILMTVVFNKFIWLASGGKSLNTEKFKPLKNRKITLFPDLNCFEDWNAKAQELRLQNFTVQISDFLEKQATYEQRIGGFDIADFYVHARIDKVSCLVMTENNYPLIWDVESNFITPI